MTADVPPAHTMEVLTLVLPEDEVRRWVARWQAAGNGARKAMETDAALQGTALARRDPERFAEQRRLEAMFEADGFEGDRGA